MEGFDSFYGRCAKCGTKIAMRIHEFDATYLKFYKGDTIPFPYCPDDITLSNRHDICQHCGYSNTIIIKNRVFVGFDKELQ